MTKQRISVRMIIQPSINHYREPLINELLKSERIDFSLFGSSPNGVPGDTRNWAKSADSETLSRVTTVPTRFLGPLRWQVGVAGTVLRGNYDAYVLEGNIYILSTWISLLVARLRGKPIFLWGHGWKRKESGTKLQIRRLFYRLSNGLMLYGDQAREYALSAGIPPSRLAVVYNSIYPAQTIEDVSTTHAAAAVLKSQMRLNPNLPTLIVSCRLTPRHRVDALADAINLIVDPEQRPNVLVVGEGSERNALEQRFERSGLHALFVGAKYEPATLAAYYRMADLAVAPAAPGLNVIQALGFGVPIVAPANDPTAGPEVEAVIDGSTGVHYTLGDAASLSVAIQALLSDHDQLIRLGETGHKLVERSYTTEQHAKAIEDCLLHWSEPGHAHQRTCR